MREEVFRPSLSPDKQREMEDEQAQATLDWIDGYKRGMVQGLADGYQDGLEEGLIRGRDDIIYQLKRLTKNNYDPDLEELFKEITGEY